MRILLVGEFSSLHKNLKEGLVLLGHEVVHVSTGDGFKEIDSDFTWQPITTGKLGVIESLLRKIILFTTKRGFDVVQFINPFIFNYRHSSSRLLIEYIKSTNGKLFYLAAGDDAYYWKFAEERMQYSPLKDCRQYELNGPHYLESAEALDFNQKIYKNSNGVIPVLYDYDVCIPDSCNKLNLIPLPINTNKIRYEPNIVKLNPMFFHGLNRPHFKGTRYIVDAMNVVKQKRNSTINFVIDGNMSIEKYLKLLSTTNVVIDQVNTYSSGMNALYSLAMGKVVIGSSEGLALDAMGLQKSPVFNVCPDVGQIVNVIEYLADHKNLFEEIGYIGRKYIEESHCYIDIAKKYLKTWNN